MSNVYITHGFSSFALALYFTEGDGQGRQQAEDSEGDRKVQQGVARVMQKLDSVAYSLLCVADDAYSLLCVAYSLCVLLVMLMLCLSCATKQIRFAVHEVHS